MNTIIAIIATILFLCIFPQVLSAIIWAMMIVVGIIAGILRESFAVFLTIFKDRRKK